MTREMDGQPLLRRARPNPRARPAITCSSQTHAALLLGDARPYHEPWTGPSCIPGQHRSDAVDTAFANRTQRKPHIPGNLDIWKNLFIYHPHGKYDGKLTKAASGWKEPDDLVEALFALCRKAVENEPLKIYMAVTDLNRLARSRSKLPRSTVWLGNTAVTVAVFSVRRSTVSVRQDHRSIPGRGGVPSRHP